jgi:hypothetical protein
MIYDELIWCTYWKSAIFDGYVELPEGNFEVKSHGLPYGVTSAPGFRSSFNSTFLIRKKQTPGFIRPVRANQTVTRQLQCGQLTNWARFLFLDNSFGSKWYALS